MKQRDLIKKLESIGFKFDHHGANHDAYSKDGEKEYIPRHSEIKETTAIKILKKWGLKK